MAAKIRATRMKLGARTFFWIFHVGGRGPNSWAICCCFPQGISRDLNQKWISQDTNQHHMGWWDCCSDFTYYIMTLTCQYQTCQLYLIINWCFLFLKPVFFSWRLVLTSCVLLIYFLTSFPYSTCSLLASSDGGSACITTYWFVGHIAFVQETVIFSAEGVYSSSWWFLNWWFRTYSLRYWQEGNTWL